METIIGTIIMLAWVTIGFAASYIIGRVQGECKIEEQAVKRGAAEFYLDANHNIKFRWVCNTIVEENR